MADLLFSAFIWYLNWSWGNFFMTCLILSLTTFLIIYTPFEIYWSIRDLWFDRWEMKKVKGLESSRIEIPVNKGHLIGEIIKSKDLIKRKSKNTIIVINHGFSDTKEKLRYLSYPLALHGHVILTYDARGIGESSKTGKRTQFLERIQDFEHILNWIQNNQELKNLTIYCIGASIGTVPTLITAFPNETIKKIVVISAISNFREIIEQFNFIVKLNYFLQGVNLNPSKKLNQDISPNLVLKACKKEINPTTWKSLAKRTFIIHAKDDRIIKFPNFKENVDVMEIPESNQLVLETGGHTQKRNELIIMAAILRFFNAN